MKIDVLRRISDDDRLPITFQPLNIDVERLIFDVERLNFDVEPVKSDLRPVIFDAQRAILDSRRLRMKTRQIDAQQAHMSRMLGRFILARPFLCIALLAGFAYGLSLALRTWTAHVEAGLAVFEAYCWLGRPFLWAGTFVHELAPNLPNWLDRTLVIVLGLAPYLLADWVWGRIRCGLCGRRCASDRKAASGCS